ncbi:hypothetical protein [Erythrobacter alti]|uniref:hypothetical protein n=1 Tax=Erythrobacter alti TaxID=1896145 RepID=UPI0030F470A4
MAQYTTLHLHNVPDDKTVAYAAWFDGKHKEDLGRLRGFRSADRFEVTPEQIMPDIAQPWRFMSVYEFDYEAPRIDLPALAPLLAEARDSGLIDDENESERIYSYRMYSDWQFSLNHQPDHPFSGVSIILANFVAGMEEEYHHWYENTHIPEVSCVPGKVGMKRGRLADVQVEPRRYCPGGELVFCAQQTDDLLFTVKDFSARARGVSPSGIAFADRSKAGSFARTVHYFRKISGDEKWPGGIAYDGDLSVYPDDFARPAPG